MEKQNIKIEQNYKSLFEKEPIPNRESGSCFGCSKTNTHGLKLNFWPIKDGCVSNYTIPDYMCGFDKIAHGGIIATLLDEVAAWALGRVVLKFGVTKDASIKYFRPVPTNVKIIIEAHVTKHNGKHVVTSAVIKDASGIIFAECESNWILPTLEQFAKMTNIKPNIIEKMMLELILPMKKYLKSEDF